MLRRLSPAKVNLHLRVLRKRADGYHDIQTLMHKITLYDEISFSPIDHGIVLSCPDIPSLENENNIIYKAAQALLSASPRQMGVHITLEKKIPLAAGLGGGSSNAATTLTALNEMLNIQYTNDHLMKIASRLGADVPFFIFGNTAWATGIGDQLTAVRDFPQLWFVLIHPPFEVSTKMVYEKLNFRLTKELLKYNSFNLSSADNIAKGLHNDLEKVTFGLYPDLQQLKDLLLMQGAIGTLMSGSGPTVFGIFTVEDKAASAEEFLRKLGTDNWSVFKAQSI